MAYYDNMTQSFACEKCVIGFLDQGTIVVDKYKATVGKHYPFSDAIENIGNPLDFVRYFELAIMGDHSVIGHYEGVNIASLEITKTGVKATLDLPDDEFKDELTFEEFAPILAVWQKAWAAAQEYKKTLKA
jgi:hypothetical protein